MRYAQNSISTTESGRLLLALSVVLCLNFAAGCVSGRDADVVTPVVDDDASDDDTVADDDTADDDVADDDDVVENPCAGAEDRATCSTGNLCVTLSYCLNQECIVAGRVSCGHLDDECGHGECNSGTGVCEYDLDNVCSASGMECDPDMGCVDSGDDDIADDDTSDDDTTDDDSADDDVADDDDTGDDDVVVTCEDDPSQVGCECSGVYGVCAVDGVLEAVGEEVVCSVDVTGSASLATTETCDGLDNDCDGTTDEENGGCAVGQFCVNDSEWVAGCVWDAGVCEHENEVVCGGPVDDSDFRQPFGFQVCIESSDGELHLMQSTCYVPEDYRICAMSDAGWPTCQPDTDRDGVADADDACPEGPAKFAGLGACGCGVADTDTDSDGTADCNDGCPEDPAKVESGVCGCGVVDVDSDGDRVFNCNEVCGGGEVVAKVEEICEGFDVEGEIVWDSREVAGGGVPVLGMNSARYMLYQVPDGVCTTLCWVSDGSSMVAPMACSNVLGDWTGGCEGTPSPRFEGAADGLVPGCESSGTCVGNITDPMLLVSVSSAPSLGTIESRVYGGFEGGVAGDVWMIGSTAPLRVLLPAEETCRDGGGLEVAAKRQGGGWLGCDRGEKSIMELEVVVNGAEVLGAIDPDNIDFTRVCWERAPGPDTDGDGIGDGPEGNLLLPPSVLPCPIEDPL